MTADLSALDARRIAIAAQGLATARPAAVDRRALRAMVERLGVVQLDSVNVLVRSHYLPAWSRLGAYDPAAFDRLSAHAPRVAFEYWGHEASLLPVALHPLLRWRMARAGEHAWRAVRRMKHRRELIAQILATVTERGPLGAGELEVPLVKKRKAGWWGWSDAKRAIEWLFWSGQVTTAARRGFERLYDLPERVLPAEILAAPTPSEADALLALVDRAGRALGVATANDLRDYYRLPLAGARTAITSAVDAGVLSPVTVEGWAKPAYLHREAPRPIAGERAALLSPFDSLVWTRERTERMFGMRFRLEIYVPSHKRVHGYYVLPFLLGDRLVARIDLKADRAAGTLRVQAAHLEGKAARAPVTAALATELGAMAAWLGLERVAVMPVGDLARSLARSRPRVP